MTVSRLKAISYKTIEEEEEEGGDAREQKKRFESEKTTEAAVKDSEDPIWCNKLSSGPDLSGSDYHNKSTTTQHNRKRWCDDPETMILNTESDDVPTHC